MPYAEVGGGRLFYVLSRGPEGAPVLVLLHGSGGSHLHWPAGLRRVEGAAVYALDLPGHGRSAGRARERVGDYAAVVAGFLDAVAIDRAVVVGHSLGGAIAMALALGFPERVAGLVLVGTGARLRVTPAILDSIREDLERAVDVIAQFAWGPGADRELVRREREMMLEAGPDVLYADFVACDTFDVMARLGEIVVPALVVVGDADRLTPVKYARYLADHIPQAELVVLEGAGHMVALERPSEVAEAVESFVARSSPGAPPRASTEGFDRAQASS